MTIVYRWCLAELNGENSRAEVQNVREECSAGSRDTLTAMPQIQAEVNVDPPFTTNCYRQSPFSWNAAQ
jgi:hypothetical protein